MIFRRKPSRDRQRNLKEKQRRRSRLSRSMNRSVQMESLEDRRVLASFTAMLDGNQEVPPVATVAAADATLELNPAGDQLQYSIELTGVDLDGLQTPLDPNDDLTALHIHQAARGDNGAVVFDVLADADGVVSPAQGSIVGIWDDTDGPSQISPLAALFRGTVEGSDTEFYINVHTVGNPSGEVRGQIVAAPFSYDMADNPGIDEVDLRVNGADLEIVDSNTGTVLKSALQSSVVTIQITGEDGGDDHLTVDFSGGNPIGANGLTFDGGTEATADGDALSIIGTFTTQTITHTPPGATGNNGDIDLDGSLITFTGLEPINAGNAADTIVNLPVGLANDATLQDSANAGEIEIIDNGATFEDTIIPNPTNSLTVNLGDQGDFLNVSTLDTAYAASLIINGGADFDTVTLDTVTLDTANVGRGLWVTETESVDILDSTITNNTAPIGGGILIDNATTGFDTFTFISNSNVSDNTATGGVAPTDGGGGIYNRGGGEMLITGGSTISDNSATSGNASGGGVFSDGILTVDDAMITGNSANRAGGGIEIADGSGFTTLANVTLDGNDALAGPGNGGGLHITGAGNSSITGGSVFGNTAAAEGGGLWNGTGTMTIDGTNIEGNTASGTSADEGGGGIFNAGGTISIDNATIVDNIADGTAGSGGGILNDASGSLTITGTLISGNRANRAGGGIEATPDTTTTLTNVNLDGNNVGIAPAVAAPGNGGGLHITGNGNATISGGTVNGNVAASEGGGLWNGTGTMDIDGTTIDGNIASGAGADNGGGGIFNAGGMVTIDAATITSNIADGTAGSGGGILNDASGTVTITGTTISSNQANRAGGGIEATPDTTTNLTDVMLSNNNAGVAPAVAAPGNGGGLHITGNGNVNITRGIVDGNTAASEGGGLWNGTGTMVVVETPIQGNTASGADADNGGGGIFNAGGTVDLDNLVISNNSADGASGSGGGILNQGGTITIDNLLIDATMPSEQVVVSKTETVPGLRSLIPPFAATTPELAQETVVVFTSRVPVASPSTARRSTTTPPSKVVDCGTRVQERLPSPTARSPATMHPEPTVVVSSTPTPVRSSSTA